MMISFCESVKSKVFGGLRWGLVFRVYRVCKAYRA